MNGWIDDEWLRGYREACIWKPINISGDSATFSRGVFVWNIDEPFVEHGLYEELDAFKCHWKQQVITP